MTKLPIPEKYAFDDTPKAFKRMLQRKNGNQEEYKKRKSDEPLVTKSNKNVNHNEHFHTGHHQNVNNATKVVKLTTASTTTTTISASSNMIRAKRKAHLQARDLKKKLKRHSSVLDAPHPSTSLRRDVRDVVQEPPKLHRPKKTFKKVRDSTEEIKSWSEDDELADEADD